jgi:hypothetical protein
VIGVSPIKLTEFRFIGDGMYEARYTHRGRRSAVQSKFDGFLIIGEELYLVCTVFGDSELMAVESFSTGFNAEKHVVELYTTLMGFPLYTN